MPNVSNDEIRRFTESIAQATTRLGGGKVGIPGDKLRQIVREQRAAAYRYVELHLVAAASQPGYRQPATMVAAAPCPSARQPRALLGRLPFGRYTQDPIRLRAASSQGSFV